MKWLCILATITTFFVETKNSVSTDGTLPKGSPNATYACSYQKGQMTAGHHATLTLEGWQNTEINRITLYMKSNKASGAGKLNATIDGNCIWRIGDSGFDTWSGGFSTSYVPISHSFNPAIKTTQGNIAITVEASQNSLYIERYEIEWTQEQARPYVVSLIEDGSSLYAQLFESSVGAGVLLPSLPNIGTWYFKGWSEQPISETNSTPHLFYPNSIYYPAHDLSLYATYSDYASPSLQKTQRIDCQSGYYAIAFPVFQQALEGPFNEDITGINACDAPLDTTENGWTERLFDIPDKMVYYIDFLTDTTAQIIHAQTGQYIGYNNTKLCQGNSIWRYRVVQDSTVCFYVPLDSLRSRTLWITIDETLYIYKGGLTTLLNSKLCLQTLLYEADYYTGTTYWTSYPYGQGIENEESFEPMTHNYLYRFGLYELRIRQGKKRLFLREMH